MRRFIFLLLVALVGMTVGCSAETMSATAGPPVRQVDPAEFAGALAGGRVAINVHTPDEGSLPDTDLAIPFDQISTRAGDLPQDRSTALAIYCMTGHMSTIAGQTLTDLGYTDIVELRGGMRAWLAAGRPMIPAGG